jgi:hypothetical protein
MTEQPNYYAIIPASVRYDSRLSASEKLLYAEITALANMRGYCNASNDYFSRLYQTKKETVSRWISALADLDYISVVVDKTIGNQRLIYIKESAPLLTKKSIGIDKKRNTLLTKKSIPIDKNVNQNTTVEYYSMNNTIAAADKKNDVPPKAAKRTQAPPLPPPPPERMSFEAAGWVKSGVGFFRGQLESRYGEMGLVDVRYYFDRCASWSSGKSKGRSADWIETAHTFMDGDKRAGKLALITDLKKNDGSDHTKHRTTKNAPLTPDGLAAHTAAVIADLPRSWRLSGDGTFNS